MAHVKYRTEKNCLNCGALVDRKFCPECGQPNIETRDNFFHMVGHFISDYLHYDSKFLQSFKSLIIKPGFLTKQYLEGKRVRYIHPLRLFFFITIFMVIMATFYYKKYEHVIKDEQITITDDNRTEKKMSTINLNELDPKERALAIEFSRAFDNISYNLKYISFFLLPLYALAFKLLYWRRKHFYVDHLIYTVHLQSFAYVLLSLLLLIAYFMPSARDWFYFALIMIILLYLILSLRSLYQQSWIKTILKSMLATALIVFISGLAMAGFLAFAIIKIKYLS